MPLFPNYNYGIYGIIIDIYIYIYCLRIIFNHQIFKFNLFLTNLPIVLTIYSLSVFKIWGIEERKKKKKSCSLLNVSYDNTVMLPIFLRMYLFYGEVNR